MTTPKTDFAAGFYGRFKIFHELMSVKIREIMLVSSPYDAFILEEDGSLASRIINEYSGLNLSLPPRVTRISSAFEALGLLKRKRFDLVITMPHLVEMDACSLGGAVKDIDPDIPVILLAHNSRGILNLPEGACKGIDKLFVWSGNSDLLLAIVKNTEDDLNVDHDTQKAMVRVLILVEDSPVYRSLFLPLLYRRIVKQTQELLATGLNEEHRLLLMRARPKILLAENYEQAEALVETYKPYLFGVISDARFPRKGKLDDAAGFRLLSRVREEVPDVPLLMLSSQSENRERAEQVPAVFLDKNAADLAGEIKTFFLEHLGFGDFVFRTPDGKEIGRARNLRDLINKLPEIPDASVRYHAERNHFSNWVMSRAEINLAHQFRKYHVNDFKTIQALREYLITSVRSLLVLKHKGIVSRFKRHDFDAELTDFARIGDGSLGGKARGLAFMSALLQDSAELHEKYPDIAIEIPQSLVVSTEGFEDFVERNRLQHLAEDRFTDDEVDAAFADAEFPDWLIDDLDAFLDRVDYPLSVRSSSRLEDAHFQPYAGLYETYMLPNANPDRSLRLRHLLTAVRKVYASTYYEGPKAFSKSTGTSHQDEAMAVLIQKLSGRRRGDFFYPDISGVAQSRNFYPVPPMKAEEGIAHIAIGMGKTVVEGERSLRFSPAHPNQLPQFSMVDDILENSQRFFYALRLDQGDAPNLTRSANLAKREIDEAETEIPIVSLCSTYIPEEHRIRDTGHMPGPKVATFAQVLKHKIFPLPDLLKELLAIGARAMGCPVEIEFAVNLAQADGERAVLHFLQMRPMATEMDGFRVRISDAEFRDAFCRSKQALGNGSDESVSDIVYVKPDAFEPAATPQMAEEIGKINAGLMKEKRPYLLIGPGRWGSSDKWLGIPVQWRHISGVRAMIELRNPSLKVDPSQGSHFFQNITSLGIFYATVTEGSSRTSDDRLDWEWIGGLPVERETDYLRHVRLESPILIKVDGRGSVCVMLNGSSGRPNGVRKFNLPNGVRKFNFRKRACD